MLLRELCQCSGAPGGEKEVRSRVISALEEMGCAYHVDRIGNVVVHHAGKGEERGLMFTAHMDEPALMVTHITEDGYLRFKTMGSYIPRQLSGRTVRVGKDVMGVLGFDHYHMMRITPEQKKRSAENQHIDIGAPTRQRAMERVNVGDFAVVDSAFVCMGEERYKGRAMASRTGCWALLELLRSKPEYAFDAVFTVLHEVGQRGVEVAAYTCQPKLVVSIDAVTATDIPGTTDGEDRVALDQGVCIALTDAGFAYPRAVANAYEKLARDNGIACRLVQYADTAAQAGFAAVVRGGALALSLLVPTRRVDASAGIVSKKDLETLLQMLSLVAAHNA